MKVLVTGATGSLGSAVVQRLSENGHTVTGLGRTLVKIKRLKERGFTVEQCNLLDQASLNQQVAGHDAIVHCAAFAAPFGRKRTFFETNVKGFNNLVQSAAVNNVGRLVVVSSASVFDGNDSNTSHSDATPEPHLRPSHPYGASKYDAECLAAT
ncbi:MAG: NAD(P)-dependent oxidoreductase, partial [Candidatus Poseidoniaceae archaeon]|nr:NAD(P)-dependent oxidoreductase [Candidatus Poseidoniaceae archaeon]